MKINLDNKKIFARFDTGQVLTSIKNLSRQLKQARQEANRIKLPESYKKARNIAVIGMGGSALGSDFLRATFLDRLKIPFSIFSDYNLPNFVGQDSLVIACSYSGNTEELLVAAQKAISQKCRLLVVTTGDKLAQLAKRYRLPIYVIRSFYNPSGQPRLGLGYLIMFQLIALKKLRFLNLTEMEITMAITFLEGAAKDFQEGRKTKDNQAKKAALLCHGMIPVIFASNPLLGNAHILANQINENAKNFAAYFALPELNHHLLEGLTHPATLRQFIFINLESDLDPPRIRRRFFITRSILEKRGLKTMAVRVKGSDSFSRSLWTLSFGSYFSFYLAMLNQEDPVKIPWVDYFKNQLAK